MIRGVGKRQEYANKSEEHGKASELEGDIQVKKKTDRVTPAGKKGRGYMTRAPDCVHGEDSCSIFGMPVVGGTDD